MIEPFHKNNHVFFIRWFSSESHSPMTDELALDEEAFSTTGFFSFN